MYFILYNKGKIHFFYERKRIMIEFEHKLPALSIGEGNGTYNNYESGFPGIFTTKNPRLGLFLHQLRNVVADDRRLVFVDGKILSCQNNWIRDCVHEMKGFKHWEYNIGSFLNFIIETQREDGQFFELIKQYDDYHWKFVHEESRVIYEEDNVALVRLELEADVEYLVVEGATNYYKVFGDNAWLSKVLPKLEKSIEYMTSDKDRWDAEHGLVKRPFTIDTWDFKYGYSGEDRRIDPDTPMSIMHGDNSGVYQAMLQLAWMNRKLEREEKALYWEEKAQKLRENMFRYLWNGSFFIHQLHLGHPGADDLESVRLSLSNSYDMNRGVTDLEQSRSIIAEYIRRKDTTEFFAEWFSIDPPYENFNGYSKGSYVNGAISPFTAGELAKAAFCNGYEEYAWGILTRFMELVERDGTTYFLYDTDSKPQPQGGPSAWGSAALISAIDEGLAGIVDADVCYRTIDFSPRFVVTDYTELRYTTGYEVTNTMVDVRFIIKDNGMRYDIISPAETVRAHILLPKGKQCTKLLVNGQEQPFESVMVAESNYVDVTVSADKKVSFEIIF